MIPVGSDGRKVDMIGQGIRNEKHLINHRSQSEILRSAGIGAEGENDHGNLPRETGGRDWARFRGAGTQGKTDG
jgi:hypothetical protein